MKPIVYLGLLIVLIFGIYFYLNNKSSNNTYVSPKTSKGIILYKEKGIVYTKNKGESELIPVGANSIEIKNQTEVTTGSSSRASVLLPDNSLISLSENTVVTINYSDYGTSVFQSLGQTYHRVQKLVTGKSYEVQTPSTLAAVRGTKFAILYDGATKKTKVAVTENLVAVSRVKKVDGVSTTTVESPILVGEGNVANVNEYKSGESKKDGQVEITSIKESNDVTNWVNENKTTDKKFDELKQELEKGNVDSFREKVDEVLDVKVEKSESEKVNEKVTENKVEDIRKDDVKKTDEIKKEEIKPDTETKKTEETKPKEDIKNIDAKPVVTKPLITIKKYASEEDFITAFDDLLIKYFYIDDDEEVCSITVSPDAKVKEILGLAEANGKTFNTERIFVLANKIKNYCSLGSDAKDRAILQSEFEAVMPSF